MHGIERSPVSAIISASPLATDCCIGFPTAIIFLALRLSMPVRFVSSTTADILSRWPSPVHTAGAYLGHILGGFTAMLVLLASRGLRAQAHQLGGSGGMPPQENFGFQEF